MLSVLLAKLSRLLTRIIEKYRDAFRGLSREVWILALIALVNRCGTMVVIFLVPYVTEEFDYLPAEAGTLLALYGLGSMVGIWLGGRFTDQFGYRPVTLVSLFGTSAALYLLGVLQSVSGLAVGAIVLGIVSDAIRPAMSVAVAQHSTEATRPRAFGLLRLSVNLGMTVGPVVGGILAEFDYGWLFRVDAGTCFLAALVLIRMLPRSSVAQSASGETAGRSAWRDGVFVVALVLTLLQALIFFQLSSTFSLYIIEERGFSKSQFGALLAINTVVIVLFEMVLVHAIERRNPLRVVAVAGLLIGIGFGILPYASSVAALAGMVLLWTIGEMLSAPMMQTWVANRAPERSLGSYLAAFGMIFSVASVLAPLIGTSIYQHAGPDWVWHACLALGVVQLVGFLALARKE